ARYRSGRPIAGAACASRQRRGTAAPPRRRGGGTARRTPAPPAPRRAPGAPPRRAARRRPGSAVDPAHAQVLDLEVVLDAVFRAFAADAAFLDPAERRDLGRDDALVDADDAVFQRLGDAPDAADIAAVEIGGEAELGIVGHADRLFVGGEAVERRHRAEGLLPGDDHVGGHPGQHGRLEEGAAERVAVAA